uniref:Uncharacterized protein n=1 Tax=Tetranychus urticae TaxID=32264 RepID=T1K178_TETUR
MIDSPIIKIFNCYRSVFILPLHQELKPILNHVPPIYSTTYPVIKKETRKMDKKTWP